MAASDVVLLTVELNKLKKSELIELLTHCSLPDNVTSEVLTNFANELSAKCEKKCNCLENADDLNNTVLSSDSVNTVINQKDNVRTEIKYLKEISEQKDKVIANQSITISTLHNHNILLNTLLKNNNGFPFCSPIADDHPAGTTSGSLSTLNSNEVPAISQNFNNKNFCNVSLPKTHKSETKSRNAGRGSATPLPNVYSISSQQVAAAVNQAAAHQKTNEILSLRDNGEDSWKTVERNRRRKNNRTIVGTGNGSSPESNLIEAVPEMSYFHVFKLHPSTTMQGIIRYLKPEFPEVNCEKLTSKYPNDYSSFKVGVLESNVSKFLEPSRWATGTRINKFFFPRKKLTTLG